MTADDIRAQRLNALTSVALIELITKIEIAKTDNATEVAARQARRASYLISGNTAMIQNMDVGLAAATLNGERLQAMHDEAALQVPTMQAAEADATATLRVEKEALNKKTVSFLTRFRTTYAAHAPALAALAQEERDILEARNRFYQAHMRAPVAARTAVPVALITSNPLAGWFGANTLGECIVALPALADPDAPDSPAPRMWPPAPPAPPPRRRHLRYRAILARPHGTVGLWNPKSTIPKAHS